MAAARLARSVVAVGRQVVGSLASFGCGLAFLGGLSWSVGVAGCVARAGAVVVRRRACWWQYPLRGVRPIWPRAGTCWWRGRSAWAAAVAGQPDRGGLRFAFYGRVSTEDYQDPVTSRARQLDQAAALVAGHGQIVAEFFDIGHSRTLAWPRRPRAAALVAALADPDRGWDAIVIGEYERAFYGGQYASMAPAVRALRRRAVDAGSRRPDRLSRRGPRADHAGAGAAVEAGDHPHQDPGPHRDGDPDPRAGPLPGRPPAVRVPARRCWAAPEQGPRRLGAAGAPAGTGPGHRAGGAVDVRASGWPGTASRGSPGR